MIIPRIWLLLSVPILGLSIWGVVKTALHLARVVGASVVARVPIRAEQLVDLPTTGYFVLSIEQRIHARTLRVSGVTLARADTGTPVPLGRVLSSSEVRTGSRARHPFADCTISQPGTYVLRLQDADLAGADAAIIIGPPIGCAIVAHVLALLVMACVVILSMIVTTGAITGAPFVSSTTTSG